MLVLNVWLLWCLTVGWVTRVWSYRIGIFDIFGHVIVAGNPGFEVMMMAWLIATCGVYKWGTVWLQYSSALESLRYWHMAKIGHMLSLHRLQYTGALEPIQTLINEVDIVGWVGVKSSPEICTLCLFIEASQSIVLWLLMHV